MNWAARALEASSDSGSADAEVLMATLLGCERSQLRSRAEQSLEAATVLRYVSWIERRKLGEPVAYVAGRQGFWTLDLLVDSSVLIPRPDTERLVEWALEVVRGDESIAEVLDLGTGSGALALAIADACPQVGLAAPAARGGHGPPYADARHHVRITATDHSESALAVARDNAKRLAFDMIEFLSGHWFQPLHDENGSPLHFDLIVSNPPYIAEHDPHLAQLRYEPRQALTSGIDGLDALRQIIAGAPKHLRPRGWLLVEHGHTQGAAVRDLLQASGFENVTTRRDYGGNERISGGQRP
ncbi:MAG: peptide chain release factor N(5)-glutamine methyltransferase [Panacagrimonas sp.]